MADPETSSESPSPAPGDPSHGGERQEFLAQSLTTAFPPVDATEEDFGRLAQVPADPRLLAATPPPRRIDFERLLEAVTGIRVVYVRGGAVVSVSALISIGGAILFHVLILAGCVLAVYLGVHIGYGGDDGSLAAEPGGSSSGGLGYMIASDSTTLTAPDIRNLLTAPPAALLPAPTLPGATEPLVSPGQLAAAELAPMPEDLSMIGIPSGDQRTGRIKPAPRALRPAAPSPAVVSADRDPAVVVAPPLPDGQATVLASAGHTGPAGRSSHVGPPGPGDDDPYANEPIIPVTKADAAGEGRGRNMGSGLDRGGSGANNPEPTILEWPTPEFSPGVYIHPPAHSIVCQVRVLASGEVGRVTVVQSCGEADLDAIWRRALYGAKFRPAYRAGKPIDADKQIEFVFTR